MSGVNSGKDCSDDRLMDLLVALVGYRGRLGATEVLEVNFRTLKKPLDTGQLTPRMRQALEKFGNSAPTVVDPETVGDGTALGEVQLILLDRRVVELETERGQLWEAIKSQSAQIEELKGRLPVLEEQSNEEIQVSSDSERAEEGSMLVPLPGYKPSRYREKLPKKKRRYG